MIDIVALIKDLGKYPLCCCASQSHCKIGNSAHIDSCEKLEIGL